MRSVHTTINQPILSSLLREVGLCNLFLITSISVFAQFNHPFETKTELDGLSDNRVTCFLRDSKGFMWIGTRNGLNRFDGKNFKIYRPGLTGRSISNEFINDLEEDQQGNLWIATQNGLNLLNPKTDSLHVFTPDDDAYKQKEKSISSNFIWDIYVDRSNRIWLAPDNRDICYYDIASKRFIYFPWKKYLSEVLPHRKSDYNSIRRIARKSDTEIWLGTSGGLFSLNFVTKNFRRYESYETDDFQFLFPDSSGKKLYFLQEPGNHLQVYDPDTDSRIEITILKSLRESLQNFIYAPLGESVLAIDPETDQSVSIKNQAEDPHSLPKGKVRSIYQDQQKKVWIATDNGFSTFNPGLNLFPFTSLPQRQLNKIEENDLFFINHSLYSAVYDSLNQLLFQSSSKNDCLYLTNQKTGKTQTLTHINGIPLKQCSVIFRDKQGLIWVFAKEHSFAYDPVSREFKTSSFTCKKENLLVSDVVEDNSNNLWIACYNDGLYRFNKNTGENIRLDSKKFISSLPTSLCFDSIDNKLWVGTFDYGLFRWNCTTNESEFFSADRNDPYSLRASLIMDIVKDKNNTTWVATYAGGISYLKRGADKKGQFNTIGIEQKLPENTIYALAVDRSGFIWASSFKGLTKISSSGEPIITYNRNNGLAFSNFASPITVLQSGEILTAADAGYIHFFPDRLQHKAAPFRVEITYIRVNRNIDFNSDTSSIAFKYNQNEIEFGLAALNFEFQSQTNFYYRLVGYNNQWINIGAENSVNFNNLDPGNYQFELKAQDPTGQYSTNIRTIAFFIQPPWWQRLWFRLLIASVVASGLWLIYRRRINAIKSKAALQEQMAELKSRALRAQMNPHFIFNSLNAIQELIVTENYTGSYQYLSKFSKLLRMVLNASENNLIPLADEIDINRLYLELESLRFKHSFHYSIQVDPTIDIESIQFPSLLLQPFVENAIWHGLMHKAGEKKLGIRFAQQTKSISCIIEDNGVGREKSAQIKAGKIGTEHFTSKGIGLAQQRIESLKALGINTASIVTTDLYDDNGLAAGTKVEITISSHSKEELW